MDVSTLITKLTIAVSHKVSTQRGVSFLAVCIIASGSSTDFFNMSVSAMILKLAISFLVILTNVTDHCHFVL